MADRIIHKVNDQVKVRYNKDWNEYYVSVNGETYDDANYYAGDDKQDAIDTAEWFAKNCKY